MKVDKERIAEHLVKEEPFYLIQGQEMEIARAAYANRIPLLLKGPTDSIVSKHGVDSIAGGNAGLTRGGTGDVLTGMIASFVGQGMDAFNAAAAGVYLHGLAGDLAARERGEVGLLASDLLDRIPAAIRQYQQLKGENRL